VLLGLWWVLAFELAWEVFVPFVAVQAVITALLAYRCARACVGGVLGCADRS
jgi:hypothetical protein